MNLHGRCPDRLSAIKGIPASRPCEGCKGREKFRIMLRFVCSLLAALLVATSAGAQIQTPIQNQAQAPNPTPGQSPTPVRVRLHDNRRIEVEVAPCDDRLCGKIVWFKWPNDAQGLPLVYLNNPDPALRSRPLLGLSILYDLGRTGERTWEDGKIYNPDDGSGLPGPDVDRERWRIARARPRALPASGQDYDWTRVR